MDVDKILVDLEVIAQVKENDKLATQSIPGTTKIFIDNTYFQSIFRTWNGYNRIESITYIDNLQKNIDNLKAFVISGSHIDIVDILSISIKKALTGLENLQTTYEQDSEIKAKLIIIRNKMEKTISELTEFL